MNIKKTTPRIRTSKVSKCTFVDLSLFLFDKTLTCFKYNNG